MPNVNMEGMDYCVFSSPNVIWDFTVAWLSDSMRLSKTSVFFFLSSHCRELCDFVLSFRESLLQ